MDTDVLIAGGGPTGLTAAIELTRRGVPVRVVDRSGRPAIGSRGDGLQPRTLEVFEDMGVLPAVFAAGIGAPMTRLYDGTELVGEGPMADTVPPRPDVPYPNPWFVPQDRDEQLLRDHLASLGVRVEQGTELVDFTQDDDGVTARLRSDRGEESVRASYLIGADGGGSVVRKTLGIGFVGETDETIRVVLADVRVSGLDHEFGYAWKIGAGSAFIGLFPLSTGPEMYVLTFRPDGDTTPEPTIEFLSETLLAASQRPDIHILERPWGTVWRLNVRMAEEFRRGRVFLAGDAAHAHPPTGGQGLNTGVQDAYNLSWKIAAVLAGASAELLDTYQDERLPIAAGVLGVSMKLLQKYVDGDEDAGKRGEETQQLNLTYRDGPLAIDDREPGGTIRAGDRAPDAPCVDTAGNPSRLFEIFAHPQWTVLFFGDGQLPAFPDTGVVRRIRSSTAATELMDNDLVDADGHIRKAYDLPDGHFAVIRPDNYLGIITNDADAVRRYLARISGS